MTHPAIVKLKRITLLSAVELGLIGIAAFFWVKWNAKKIVRKTFS